MENLYQPQKEDGAFSQNERCAIYGGCSLLSKARCIFSCVLQRWTKTAELLHFSFVITAFDKVVHIGWGGRSVSAFPKANENIVAVVQFVLPFCFPFSNPLVFAVHARQTCFFLRWIVHKTISENVHETAKLFISRNSAFCKLNTLQPKESLVQWHGRYQRIKVVFCNHAICTFCLWMLLRSDARLVLHVMPWDSSVMQERISMALEEYFSNQICSHIYPIKCFEMLWSPLYFGGISEQARETRHDAKYCRIGRNLWRKK